MTTSEIETISYSDAMQQIEDMISSQPGQDRSEMLLSDDPAGDYQALSAIYARQGEPLEFTEAQYLRYIEAAR